MVCFEFYVGKLWLAPPAGVSPVKKKMKKHLCPECFNPMVRSGVVTINRSKHTKQQWKCPVCGRRTLNPVHKAVVN